MREPIKKMTTSCKHCGIIQMHIYQIDEYGHEIVEIHNADCPIVKALLVEKEKYERNKV